MMVPTPYVNDFGDVWFARGDAPWPRIQHEAAEHARDTVGWNAVAVYQGIQRSVRVTDEHECPHATDDECFAEVGSDSPPCCRTVDAYHFLVEER
jgi:hypothetical protein